MKNSMLMLNYNLALWIGCLNLARLKKHEFLFNVNWLERFEARSKQLPRHDCKIRLDILVNWHLNTRHKKYAIRKNPILRSLLLGSPLFISIFWPKKGPGTWMDPRPKLGLFLIRPHCPPQTASFSEQFFSFAGVNDLQLSVSLVSVSSLCSCLSVFSFL